MTVNDLQRFRLHPHAAHRAVASEVFVVTDDRAFHRLVNASAVTLFDALAQAPGGLSAQDLQSLLLAQFDVDPARARRDVDAFLQLLVERHLAVPVAVAGTPTVDPGPAEVSP